MKAFENPSLIIFSSGKLVPIAEAIRDNLSSYFTVTPWTEGFFRSNEIPLNTFLKKLLAFDAAVVVLGADDLRENEKDGGQKNYVPRDNVIFELGACMSRLGTQKTFIVVPKTPEVVLPSYFKGIYPLRYESRSDNNLRAAVGSACSEIRHQFQQLDQNAYYSDLPAQGLAFGYYYNFVSPVYKRLRSCEELEIDLPFKPGCKFCLNVVIPKEFLGRAQVDQICESRGLVKFDVQLRDGRNICIYRRKRKTPEDPLTIYDIPTTLLTSRRVIEKVDAFWGGGQKAFKELLEKREIVNFCRAISDIIESDTDLSAGCVEVLNMEEFEEALKNQN